jgi:toluene monooxygenase system ferredoxin subunit
MVAPETLEHVPFFESLAPNERELLARLAHRRHYHAGEQIFAEGEQPDALRVLVRGMVSFRQRQRHGGEPVRMGGVDECGDVFGISAVVGRENLYPHSAVCLEETDVIEVDGPELLSLCESDPTTGVHILQRLATVMAQRLAATREQIRSRIRPGLISHG